MYANDLARQISVPLVSVPPSRDERLAREGTSSEEANSHAEAIGRIIGESTVANAPTNVEVGADLIVVARQPAPSHVSMNSPLARVLRNAPRPVLVLPAGAAVGMGIPPATSAAIAETALSR
jgi:hypothetical protein